MEARLEANDKSATPAEDRKVLWLGHGNVPLVLAKFAAHAHLTLHTRDDATWPAPRISLLQSLGQSDDESSSLKGRRIGVLHPDPGAADAIAEAVRAKGARAVVLSLSEAGITRAEALDPEVIVLSPTHMLGACRDMVEALWNHSRMRWIPLLLVPDARLGPAGLNAPDVRELATAVGSLCAEHLTLERRAQSEATFEFPLQQLGPTRVLRALLESGHSLRACFRGPAWVIEVDVTEGIVVGARAGEKSVAEETLLGVHALGALNSKISGTVQVRKVERPAATNVMAPLDALLLGEYRAPAFISDRPIVVGNLDQAVAKAAPREPEPAPPANSNAELADTEHEVTPARGVPAQPPQRPSATALPPLRLPAALSQPGSEPKPTPSANKPLPPLRINTQPVSEVSAARSEVSKSHVSALEDAIAGAFADYAAASQPPASLLPATEIEILVSEPPPRGQPPGPDDLTPYMGLDSDDVVAALEKLARESEPKGRTRSRNAWLVVAAVLGLGVVAGGAALALRRPRIETQALVVAPPTLRLVTREPKQLPAVAALDVAPAIVEPAVAPAPSEPTPEAVAEPSPEPVADAPAPSAVAATTAPAAVEPARDEAPNVAAVRANTPSAEANPTSAPGSVRPSDADLARADELVLNGHKLRREGQHDAARATYEQALSVVPAYPRALAGIVETYLATGSAQKALATIEELFRHRTRFADDYRMLGDVYVLLNRQKDAAEAYRFAGQSGSRIAREKLQTLTP